MDSTSPLEPKVVLGVAAHPDDLDFGAAGTLSKWAGQGAKVYYLVLTDGSKGSSDPSMTPERLSAIRHKEQIEALRRLGGEEVTFLDYPDGFLEITMELKRDIVKAIRSRRPDVVVTIDPTMVYSADRGFINHPDHRAAGQATLDAVFPMARDHMTFPELYADGHMPHKTATVLLVNFDRPNYFHDVSDVLKTKFEIMSAHQSQGFDSSDVRDKAEMLMSKMGSLCGYDYAESFVRIDIELT